jgi:hypothetical protein
MENESEIQVVTDKWVKLGYEQALADVLNRLDNGADSKSLTSYICDKLNIVEA